MNPLKWMGAVRMRVQTADKNTTITLNNPQNSNPLVNVLWSEKLRFVIEQL